MDIPKAIIVLEMGSKSLTLDIIKKQYHKLALQYHPDKRGDKEKFQQIQEAYELLKREIVAEAEAEVEVEDSSNNKYTSLLHSFIAGLFQESHIISSLIENILSGYKEITLKMFEGMDKERTLDVYNFLFKYKNILYISEDILEKVSAIIVEKYKDVQIFVLNPTTRDLFESKIYKLDIEGTLYFVPLWYSEMVFDGKKGDIIVKCIPELPDNVCLDENNNLIADVRIPFTFSLFESKTIPLFIEDKRWDIPLNHLFMKQRQTYVFKKCGIVRIAENDIYNINQERGDVIFNIIFFNPQQPHHK